MPTNVKPGDRVLLPGWGGNSIKVGEEVSKLCLCVRAIINLYHSFIRSIIYSRILRFWPKFRNEKN